MLFTTLFIALILVLKERLRSNEFDGSCCLVCQATRELIGMPKSVGANGFAAQPLRDLFGRHVGERAGDERGRIGRLPLARQA